MKHAYYFYMMLSDKKSAKQYVLGLFQHWHHPCIAVPLKRFPPCTTSEDIKSSKCRNYDWCWVISPWMLQAYFTVHNLWFQQTAGNQFSTSLPYSSCLERCWWCCWHKLFTTQVSGRSPPHTQIHTLAAEATMSGATCSSGAITIHTHIHAPTEEPMGAVWGSVSCQRTFWLGVCWRCESNHGSLYLLSHSQVTKGLTWSRP